MIKEGGGEWPFPTSESVRKWFPETGFKPYISRDINANETLMSGSQLFGNEHCMYVCCVYVLRCINLYAFIIIFKDIWDR